MQKHRSYSLSQIIDYVINTNFTDDDFCLYGNDEFPLDLQTLYWFSDYPEVIDNKEVYPADVPKEFSFIYQGEHFIDVIYSALEQKPSATKEDLLKALLFYYDNDNFITF